MGGSKRPDGQKWNYDFSHGVRAGGLQQDTAGCRCVRLRVLALRRVGKRGAFAKTLMTSGGPQLEPPRAPVLQASESSLRLPGFVQRADGHEIKSRFNSSSKKEPTSSNFDCSRSAAAPHKQA